MGAPEAAPNLAYQKSDGSLLSRIEMEQQIKSTWKIVHWVRLKACELYNLPKQAAFGMREATLRHWVLDEMIRRGQVVGNIVGVSTTNFEDEAEQRQFVQQLSALVQAGQALMPTEGEGVDMSGFQQPPPPPAPPGPGGPPNGTGQPPQGFTPPPPPQMGGHMQPPPPQGYAPPPPQGYAPQGPPQMAPQPPQQFAPPPMAPPQAPQMMAPQGYPQQPQQQGYPQQPQMAPPQMAPQPGYPQQPQMAPPQPGYPPVSPGAVPPGPPAPPVAGGSAPQGRGRRKAAADTQQSASVPPPQQAAPVPPMGQAYPQGAPGGVPLPPAGFAPLAPQPQQPMQQQAAGQDPTVAKLQAEVAKLQSDLGMALKGIAVLIDGFYQRPGNADIVASLQRCNVKVP